MKQAFFVCVVAAASAVFATGTVGNLDMTQDADSTVRITYDLDGGSAIVTVDIMTNGVSVGGRALWTLSGDVGVKISQGTGKKVAWVPPPGFDGSAGVTAVVKAWALDDPPPYMTVNLRESASPRCRYYLSEDALPGGLLSNSEYWTSLVVMRRCEAKNVEWRMGTDNSGEPGYNSRDAGHDVVLDHDYYLAVFEFTQGQWCVLHGSKPACGRKFEVEPLHWQRRPVENYPWHTLRGGKYTAGDISTDAQYTWPNAPAGTSTLGRLRSRTSVDFDFPGEAEWEFACRAGNYGSKWGDGTSIGTSTASDANLAGIGAYSGNATRATEADVRAYGERNSYPVGSFKANDWGFYDMHGNVREWCNDWYRDDISGLNGAVNCSSDGSKFADGTDVPETLMWSGYYRFVHVSRGGSYNGSVSEARASAHRPSASGTLNTDGYAQDHGFRLRCPVPAEAE